MDGEETHRVETPRVLEVWLIFSLLLETITHAHVLVSKYRAKMPPQIRRWADI